MHTALLQEPQGVVVHCTLSFQNMYIAIEIIIVMNILNIHVNYRQIANVLRRAH